eukprot:GFYU01033322.1.p1 GENE.GFYU01033322.1~~GFYU01033322.1.p1  ORF type:complete len:270 (-),score=57.25 GFYU01033322.1:75-800(-)
MPRRNYEQDANEQEQKRIIANMEKGKKPGLHTRHSGLENIRARQRYNPDADSHDFWRPFFVSFALVAVMVICVSVAVTHPKEIKYDDDDTSKESHSAVPTTASSHKATVEHHRGSHTASVDNDTIADDTVTETDEKTGPLNHAISWRNHDGPNMSTLCEEDNMGQQFRDAVGKSKHKSYLRKSQFMSWTRDTIEMEDWMAEELWNDHSKSKKMHEDKFTEAMLLFCYNVNKETEDVDDTDE